MVWKVVIERVTVIKFRMDNGGGLCSSAYGALQICFMIMIMINGAGCSEVEIWADTAKFTNVIVARFRKC